LSPQRNAAKTTNKLSLTFESGILVTDLNEAIVFFLVRADLVLNFCTAKRRCFLRLRTSRQWDSSMEKDSNPIHRHTWLQMWLWKNLANPFAPKSPGNRKRINHGQWSPGLSFVYHSTTVTAKWYTRNTKEPNQTNAVLFIVLTEAKLLVDRVHLWVGH
jgi:hypothetical protein